MLLLLHCERKGTDMHRLAAWILIALCLFALCLSALCLSAQAAAPALAASRSVHVPAPGRGELAAFADLAGSWEGTGADASGPYAMRASIGALFGGHYITILTVEERGGRALRERLEIWGSKDAVQSATVYEANAPTRVLAGQSETESASLSAQNDACQVTWTRTADGLGGTRHDEIDGETTWSLKRSSGASLEARRRGDVEHYEFFDGELKGDGESAVTPGQMAGAHFTAQEFGTPLLSDTIVYSRQTLNYDNGKRVEAVLVHGAESGKPFRHVYDSRGVTRHFTGAFTHNKQIEFTGDADFGTIKVSLVTTCGGYKMITDWLRPNEAPVWVGYVEMNNIAGSDKALRR